MNFADQETKHRYCNLFIPTQKKIEDWVMPNTTILKVGKNSHSDVLVLTKNKDNSYSILRLFMIGDKVEISVDMNDKTATGMAELLYKKQWNEVME